MSFIFKKHGYRDIVMIPFSRYPWYPGLWHYPHFADGKTKTEEGIVFILQQCTMSIDSNL